MGPRSRFVAETPRHSPRRSPCRQPSLRTRRHTASNEQARTLDLFLVAGILLAITVLLALRIYKTTVIHRTHPEPVHPTPGDSGIRA